MTPATPYLAVDLPRLRSNIERTAQRAAAAGVELRPHVKTHKCLEIGRLQLAAGAQAITVATIGEAEVFASHGFDDVLIAFPLWADETSARRLRDLLDRTRLSVGVDSVEGAANLGRHLGGTALRVLVEVDSGHHRTGAAPDLAGEVALIARRAGLHVDGVFTFPGHSYAPGALAGSASDEAAALRTAAQALHAAGIEPSVVSGGSTPSLTHSDTDLLTELRPGVYVFGDAQQWELGAMPPEDIALTCRTTVISHAGGRMVVDAGSKALGADRAPYASGFGRMLTHPDARVVLLSEHHAVVDLAGAALPPLGTVVELVPNHACNAVNLADQLHVVDSTGPAIWQVAARGLNS
ncbi:alanine racemase [Nocardioides pacificus]